MQGIDVCHVDDTIFDVAFLSSNELVAILQDTNRVLHVFKGLLDVESRIIRVVTPVTSSCISIRKHYSTSVIIDENGPVLISYPVTFRKRSPNDTTDDDAKIELLHLHDYYRMNGVKTITVYPRVKDKIALFCDPFIYRNHVYLFNRFETSVLCIAISGDDRETVRLLNTYPDPCYGIPDSKYANRCSLVLADVVLIYCYQRLDKPDQEPQLWKLELGPMRWHQLQLSLSTHTPSAQVCLQRAALNSVAFLHGECRRRTCQEKAHLYQLSLDQDCVQSANGPTSFLNKLSGIGTLVDKLTDSVKRSISSVDIHFMSPSTSDSANVSSAVPPVPSSINNSARTPPTVRYAARKTARTKVCKPNHRSSSVTCSKRSGVILSECPTQERAHSVISFVCGYQQKWCCCYISGK
ncbi:hypothetical protein AB6A40_003165 [Gnathostoma spinigerum]|uniref:Uncharacterized protein n=1 Tax=Gnathostoma spinigerum TaxID=75299 RepID=A0ABD6EB82_9BILA